MRLLSPGALQCPEVGENRGKAGKIGRNQERGSWKPSEGCSREGVLSCVEMLLIEYVISEDWEMTLGLAMGKSLTSCSGSVVGRKS